MEKSVVVKIKDEVSPVLQKIAENIREANRLLAENKALLEQVIHGSLEVV